MALYINATNSNNNANIIKKSIIPKIMQSLDKSNINITHENITNQSDKLPKLDLNEYNKNNRNNRNNRYLFLMTLLDSIDVMADNLNKTNDTINKIKKRLDLFRELLSELVIETQKDNKLRELQHKEDMYSSERSSALGKSGALFGFAILGFILTGGIGSGVIAGITSAIAITGTLSSGIAAIGNLSIAVSHDNAKKVVDDRLDEKYNFSDDLSDNGLFALTGWLWDDLFNQVHNKKTSDDINQVFGYVLMAFSALEVYQLYNDKAVLQEFNSSGRVDGLLHEQNVWGNLYFTQADTELLDNFTRIGGELGAKSMLAVTESAIRWQITVLVFELVSQFGVIDKLLKLCGVSDEVRQYIQLSMQILMQITTIFKMYKVYKNRAELYTKEQLEEINHHIKSKIGLVTNFYQSQQKVITGINNIFIALNRMSSAEYKKDIDYNAKVRKETNNIIEKLKQSLLEVMNQTNEVIKSLESGVKDSLETSRSISISN